MCIAIYKKRGLTLSEATLKKCFESNPDGAGYMWTEELPGVGSQIQVRKGFFDFNTFYACWKEQAEKLDTDYVLHFRWATHGEKDKHNCHPHRINQRVAYVHNGILPIDVPVGSSVSDTILFARQYLNNLPRHWERSQKWLDEVGKRIGWGNKLIIMARDGHIAIVNENHGVWDSGVWYSNSGFRTYSYKYVGCANYSKYIGHEYFKESYEGQDGLTWKRGADGVWLPENKLGADFCHVCRRSFASESERLNNICDDCAAQFPRETCSLCRNVELISDAEIVRGTCYYCNQKEIDAYFADLDARDDSKWRRKGRYTPTLRVCIRPGCKQTLVGQAELASGVCWKCETKEALNKE